MCCSIYSNRATVKKMKEAWNKTQVEFVTIVSKKSDIRKLKGVTAKGALRGMKVVLKGANACAK